MIVSQESSGSREKQGLPCADLAAMKRLDILDHNGVQVVCHEKFLSVTRFHPQGLVLMISQSDEGTRPSRDDVHP